MWWEVNTDEQNGEAIVWDTNRLRYIRTLQTPHKEPLVYSAINEADVRYLLELSSSSELTCREW